MKLFSAIVCCCLGVQAFSQITLTSANAPAAGSVRAYVKIDSTGLTPGAAGASVSWDYSAAVIDTNHSSASYLASGSTAYAPSFPGSTVAVASGTGFVYYATNSSSFDLLGSETPTSGVRFSDSEELLAFPFSYTNTFSDNFRGHSTGSSLADSLFGSNSAVADAWGTLKVPGGATYTNALRVKNTETYVDSVIGIVGFHYTTITYNWYVSTQSSPVFYLQYFSTFPSSNPSSVNKSKTAWFTYTPAAGIEEQDAVVRMLLYPNPLCGQEGILNYTLPCPGHTVISILNPLGQEVKRMEKGMLAPGTYAENLETALLTRGMYWVRISCGTTRAVQKLIIK